MVEGSSTAYQPLKLFISYSHKDERFREQLEEHLHALKRRNLIEAWHDRRIAPGQEWEGAIHQNLEASGIILLLVSSSFLASQYSYDKEMKRALEKHESGEARVIPVILRPVYWSDAPFARLQALPRNGRPVTKWSNRDEAWLDVARGIHQAVEELTSERGSAISELQDEAERASRYREAVESVWANGHLNQLQVQWLDGYASSELGLDADSIAAIEREVMGDTKVAILEAQEQTVGKEERNKRLEELYSRARGLHRDREWQAVLDVFEQIRAEDPDYPDPQGLFESAREALEQTPRVADLYDRGLRHMDAEEWAQALQWLEEVQQLEPGYRDTEEVLTQVRQELAESTLTRDWGSLSKDRWDQYTDFDLEIQEKSEPHKYPVSASSARGQTHSEMRFPFDERELKEELQALEIALLRSGGKRRRIDAQEEQMVRKFGRALFEALLGGEIRASYEESLLEARRQNKGVRLRLHVRPPELSAVPWEFIYDPIRDYLGLSSTTLLVRYLEAPQPIDRLAVTPPLRILGMVASPRGLPQLDVGREKRRVEEATRGLRAEGMVELTWLEGQTWRDLQRVIRRGPWHIFHFVGHGGFDPETEEGAIALSGEAGRKDLLRATALARLLDDHFPLRLVFLNSCEGARGSDRDAFSSTAATLVRRGVPAVVAMQYEITDEAAIEFSRDFYEAVADGLPVDAAVAEARAAVSISSALEWGTPVLYMRSSDGRIFDIQQTTQWEKGPPERLERLEHHRRGTNGLSGRPDSLPGEREPKPDRPPTLPGWQ